MATAKIQYSFVGGTEASADEVNINFNLLRDFLNNDVIHRDGSKQFMAVQSMPGTPTSPSHIANKKYVDSMASSILTQALDGGVRYGGTSSPLQGNPGPSPKLIVKAGRNAGTTSLAGGIRVNYPSPFPGGTLTIQITSLYFGEADLMAVKTIEAMNNDGFTVAYSLPATTRQPYGGRHVDFTWLALGF